MIRKASKTLPEVPVRTFKCIPFREVPEVYHRFMDILHCFISPEVSLPMRGISPERAYLVLQMQSSPHRCRKGSGLQEGGLMGSIVLFIGAPTILSHHSWEPKLCFFPSVKEWQNEKNWGFGVFHSVNALFGCGGFFLTGILCAFFLAELHHPLVNSPLSNLRSFLVASQLAL